MEDIIFLKVHRLRLWMVHCIVAGSRTITNKKRVFDYLDKILINKKDITIISGKAKGIDTIAEEYAKIRKLNFKGFSANWNNGKSAGYKRNLEMHEYISKFNDRGCICFWDGKSKGTTHNFGLCKKYNTQLRVIKIID